MPAKPPVSPPKPAVRLEDQYGHVAIKAVAGAIKKPEPAEAK